MMTFCWWNADYRLPHGGWLGWCNRKLLCVRLGQETNHIGTRELEMEPDFRLSQQPCNESFQKSVGDEADLILGLECIVKDLSVYARGASNTVLVGDGVRLEKVKLEIEGDNNQIFIADGATLINCWIRIGGFTNYGNFRGADNRLRIGASSTLLQTMIEAKGTANELEIGRSVYIHDHAELFLFGFGCAIRIGDRTSATSAKFRVEEIETSINVGTDNMFAPWVNIFAGDSHPIFGTDDLKRINSSKSINIGSHVWVGSSAQLLKGAHVGDHCVIGAFTTIFSPVTFKDSGRLAHNAVIFGMPAEVQVQNVDWSREMFYDSPQMEKYPDACAFSSLHKGHYLVRKGNVLLAENRDDEARAMYETALKLYDQAVDTKHDYVYAYCALGVAQVHVAQIALFVEDLNSASTHLGLALRSFERALEFDPQHGDSEKYRDVVIKIMEQLTAVREHKRTDWKFLVGLGSIHASLAQPEESLAEGALAERESNAARSYREKACQVDSADPDRDRACDELGDMLNRLARAIEPSRQVDA